ncbi:DUF4011 domain-containing protein [Candidatus Marinimicrobia bacterium PRS2]|nr:DUF4011 domain-containing protein [Candidatus Marinimicrobia bacterium PRS2]
MEEQLLKKIEQWKKSLLDLSRRNPLIAFKSPKRTSLRIVDEIPSEVFRQIVIDQDKFEFLPKETKEDELVSTPNQFDSQEDLELEETIEEDEIIAAEFFKYTKEKLDDKHTDTFLQTNLDEENLFKNLISIDDKARMILDEQGYNNLFLTLGMLEWYDSKSSDKKNRSPLVMVPVELTKKSIRMPFGLIRADEDPLMNMSLQQKLNEDFKIEIPDLEFTDDFEPQDYIAKVQEIISGHSQWKVTNDIYLGFFSFASFVMFKDLEAHLEKYKTNLIIQALSGISEAFKDVEYDDPIEDRDLDIERHPKDIYHVMDADSSQDGAIEMAKTGRNFVIMGPPGTGKSQTITNIVADSLGRGKSVLFVSEKMAALDVVYNRLQSVGLGSFCLELHSRKANKKHVLEQIKEGYDFEVTKMPRDGYLNELKEKRDKLNEYVDFIHEPIDQLGKSTYWLLGQLNQLRDIEIIDFNVKDLGELPKKEFEYIVLILETITDRIDQIGHPHKHPYYGTNINDTSQLHQQQLIKDIEAYIKTFNEFLEQIKKLESAIPIKVSNTKNAQDYCKLLEVLSETHKIPLSLLEIEDIEKYYSTVSPTLEIIVHSQNMGKKTLCNYDKDILKEELKPLYRDFKGEYSSFTRYFKPNYYKAVNLIKGFATKDISIFAYEDILNDISNLIKYNVDVKFIKEIEPPFVAPLGNLWNGINTDAKSITTALEWLISFNKSKVDDSDTNSLVKLIEDSKNIPEDLESINNELKTLINSVINDKTKIEDSLKVDTEMVYLSTFEETTFNDISGILESWHNNVDKLVDWVRYRKAYEKCDAVGLGSYIDDELNLGENTNSIVLKYKKKYYYSIFENIKSKNPILGDFEALLHEQLVERFKELDISHIELCKYRIQKTLVENRPDKNWSGSKSSELGIIQKQFRLKRGQMALRKLFSKASNVIQKICPCFMMSPMSVSQYIDPSNLTFDLVIFDEASQIKPEHSVGPIIRGEQLIVVGDEKQLPPTSFFNREILIEDEEEPLLPSILDETLTLSCFKESDLRWHYRSRNESLIHFSNLRFYSNRLNTFPSITRTSTDSGIELIYIENSVYDRGGTQTNRAEADAIVQEIFKHYKENPELSIGVVALSMRQRKLITDLLHNELLKNPGYEKLFNTPINNEKIFIKNLETVQGDERDIILISIGYGKDASGRLYMNFGPINKDGGWRRLNVLITRARVKIKVFSSILGGDFNLSKTQSTGVLRLKEYLEYAQSGGDMKLGSEKEHGDMDIDNPFETSVAEQLDQEDIKYIPQVGQSGYKIDFGIIDPSDNSKYLLALECDGATYHSTATARDRDRIRQSVLEDLGWRFHRIWSTDWFQNPKREMQRLKDAISLAKKKDKRAKVRVDTEIEFDEVEEISSNNSKIKVIEYDKYEIDPEEIQSSDWFYRNASATSMEELELFENIILAIIKKESPIHKNELSLRVIQHYSMGTVGSQIRRIMASWIAGLSEENEIRVEGDFIFFNSQDLNFVRKRNIENSVDIITLIAPEELHNAITYILDNELMLPREELIMQISRLLRYRNTGLRIQKYVGGIIDDSIDELLTIKDGSLILKT